MTATATATAKARHILMDTLRGDPDGGRAEAFAFCGYGEECSGSGRHGLLGSDTGATCAPCVAGYRLREAERRADDDGEA